MVAAVAPTIEFDEHDLKVRFDHFDIESYQLFLKIKAIPEFHLEFDRPTEAYTIRAPKRFAGMLGVKPPVQAVGELALSDFLYDDQRAITTLALDAKRFAVWSDCGLGKTVISLEFARHVIHRTGGRVLIVTLNDIVDQFVDEAKRFYGDSLPIVKLTSRAAMREWCKGSEPGLAITNYEKFNPEDGDNNNQVITELRLLAGLILDESSRLKTGGGRQKWAIIKSSKGIEYKLSCTATPAPNDTMEFASQAAFLERMRSEGDIIWTYFHRDKKTHRWTVKKHAREGFFRFMSSWSIYVRDPRKYGWRMDHTPVPDPIIKIEEIPATEEQLVEMRLLQRDETGQLMMFEKDNTNAIERMKLSEVAKGFIYEGGAAAKSTDHMCVDEMKEEIKRLKKESVSASWPVRSKTTKPQRTVRRIPSLKPAAVAKMAAEQIAAGRNTLIWTQFDAETDILAEELKALGLTPDIITGRVPKKDRHPILQRFRDGKSSLLIGRAKMIGYGQNFQRCGAMGFSGWNDSFEEWYQAIRRAVRHGQLEHVYVFVPVIRELEGDMLDNIFGKEAKHLAAVDEMESNYIAAMKGMCL